MQASPFNLQLFSIICLSKIISYILSHVLHIDVKGNLFIKPSFFLLFSCANNMCKRTYKNAFIIHYFASFYPIFLLWWKSRKLLPFRFFYHIRQNCWYQIFIAPSFDNNKALCTCCSSNGPKEGWNERYVKNLNK